MSAPGSLPLDVEPLRAAARPLLESLPFPVLLIDADYGVNYRNPAAERSYGTAEGTCYELTHGYSRPCHESGELCPMSQAMHTGSPATVCHAHVSSRRLVTLQKVIAVPLEGGGVLECHIGLDDLISQDGLTQVWGRGFFVRIVERELTLLRRLGAPYAFLVVDLDDFKAINDAHGHDVGDEVLRQTAGTLKRSLRRSDSVGRWGGDEFVMFLPSVKRASAEALAVRRAAAIQRLVIPSTGSEVHLRASFGVYWSDRSYDLRLAFRDADRALYAAKREGGGRVVMA